MDDTAESEEERESRPEANETEGEEMAIPQEMQFHQEMANPAVNNVRGKGKKKAVKASISCPPPTARKSPKTVNRTLRNRHSNENR